MASIIDKNDNKFVIESSGIQRPNRWAYDSKLDCSFLAKASFKILARSVAGLYRREIQIVSCSVRN